MKSLYDILEEWADKVKPKWHPKEGLFTGDNPQEIADYLLKHSEDRGQAMQRLVFYMNRAGNDCPNKTALNKVKKLLSESILDKDFDIKDPDTNFKGAQELADYMDADNWQYFGVDDAFVYKSTKVKFYEMQEVIGNIIQSNKSSDNKCIVAGSRGEIYLSYPINDKKWKICEISKQGNTGNIIISINNTDMETFIRQRTRPSYCKVPVGVVDLIEWCLKQVKK